MFVYLLISLVANYCNVEAAPIFIDRADTRDSPNPASVIQRTLFGIVWSCLSTIIICAWTAVHPNVPPPNQWKARWNRLGIMFWMIIAPELVLAWAVRQFFAAREIRDTYNGRHSGAYHPISGGTDLTKVYQIIQNGKNGHCNMDTCSGWEDSV